MGVCMGVAIQFLLIPIIFLQSALAKIGIFAFAQN